MIWNPEWLDERRDDPPLEALVPLHWTTEAPSPPPEVLFPAHWCRGCAGHRRSAWGFRRAKVAMVLAGMLAFSACIPSDRRHDQPERHTALLCRATRAIVMEDGSRSVGANRTPPLRLQQLEPIIHHLQGCGGELAIGRITGTSSGVLVRLTIKAPPAAPRPPDPTGTAFQRAAAHRAYAADSTSFATRDSIRRRTTAFLLSTFRDTASKMLADPRSAKRTDFWGAVARAALFLEEPHDSSAYLAVIFVTDGLDNVHRPRLALPRGTDVFVVNGQPSAATQALPGAVAFESIDAAMSYLISRSEP